MGDENCDCGHSWSDHYDCSFCMEDDCGCMPCQICGVQFQEPTPMKNDVCVDCIGLQQDLGMLLGE